MSDPTLTRKLDRNGGKLYRRAADVLRQEIAAGRLRAGMALPPEAELAAGFAVSLITVRQALRELEGEGLIAKRSGRAAVVTAGLPRVARVANTLEDVIANASDARLEVFGYRHRLVPKIARALGLAPSTACPCLHGRLLMDGRPMTEFRIHFPPAVGDRLRREDFDDVVVFRTVQRKLGIRLSGAKVTIGADIADRMLAKRLQIAPGAAVLVSTMLYRDAGGVPVELTVARHPAELFELSYEIPA